MILEKIEISGKMFYNVDTEDTGFLEMIGESGRESVKKQVKIESLEQAKKEQLQQRKELLAKGTFTTDGKFYFTERTAEKFVMDYASLEADEKLVWRRADTKELVELTKEEAKPYVQEIKAVLRSVYGLMDN